MSRGLMRFYSCLMSGSEMYALPISHDKAFEPTGGFLIFFGLFVQLGSTRLAEPVFSCSLIHFLLTKNFSSNLQRLMSIKRPDNPTVESLKDEWVVLQKSVAPVICSVP